MEEGNNNNNNNNHLDADARLPPRKRLLAGLKKQNCDGSSCSSDVSNRIRDLLNANGNGVEEIVEASKAAAIAAANVAAAARVAAEEKAAVAAKAVAAAKRALDLVALFSVRKARKEKAKKNVPVQVLYKKRKRGKKGETDEEVARKLHRVMNSSPRIAKNPSGSDANVNTHKKHRKRLVLETTTGPNGKSSMEGRPSYPCDTSVERGDTVQRDNRVKLNDKSSESTKIDRLERGSLHANGEAEASQTAVLGFDDTALTSRKRGKIKRKTLSLSLCAVRDRENTKEPKSRGLKSVKEIKGKSTSTVGSMLTVEPSTEVEVSHEVLSTWKHKELSAPQCYAGSNILQSLCSNPTVTSGSAMIEVDQ